jgi:cell wall-associated NlpC family hydrolase
VSLAASAAALAIILPGGASDAQTRQTSQPRPSLSTLVAQAKQLSNQVDSLSQQYDGLKIQFSHAKTEAQLAKLASSRASKALDGSRQAVAQLAAAGYMNNGSDPTLQMLTSGSPEQFLSQASTMWELDNQAGQRLTTLQRVQLAAARAQATATEQIAAVNKLQKQINTKVKAIQNKLNLLNSAAMAQAMDVFRQTGQYPTFTMPLATSVSAVALRNALSKRGDPYVWGAAGPDSFDCSGLVVWAFAQEGISLPHYTGSLWNLGMHVSRSNLEPGDLVFFYQDISHMGIYIGDGLMVDAPSTGQDVMVQQIDWGVYVGAVRIV